MCAYVCVHVCVWGGGGVQDKVPLGEKDMQSLLEMRTAIMNIGDGV